MPGAGACANSSATWALTLAIASAVLCTIGAFVWVAVLGNIVLQKTGANATQAQQAQALQEILASGSAPIHPFSVIAVLSGTFCGIAALILAVRSLVRRENRQVMAIAACIISACFVGCQIMLMLAMAGSATGQT
jgi:hypothetical protein